MISRQPYGGFILWVYLWEFHSLFSVRLFFNEIMRMGADEEGTLNRLRSIRADVIDPKITEHRGRIVKTTGDGLLVEFSSVVDALRCATEWQTGMTERNAATPGDNCIEFRIGVHQGEEFAEEALLEPLGIQDELWDRFPNGDAATSGGLRLRTRDLAKLGQLVLDGGVWHGRQIVSAGWIKQMIAPQSPRGLSFSFARSYGYLWWQGHSIIGDHDIEWVGALGRGGQRLYVVPTLNLVVAVTAGLYVANGGSPATESLAGDTALNSFVLPAALGQ
jgi:Beta-lactamase